jgi:hypothetical protein
VPTSKDAPPIGKPILANLPSADASFEVAMDREDKPNATRQGRTGKQNTIATRNKGKRTTTAAKGARGKTVARKGGGASSKKVASSRKQSGGAKPKARSSTKSVASQRNRPSS